ncbi:MAG: DUF4388 domain-containing protein [candidate division KSB1 bacterium]|nr:DUF4388 domain-containing protein [candidate division KSB1 bacterium]MDZ7319613.1 DUF4388 domain-containing protein [candidate division KSB1 bacterium]MDZ7342612.1 DUF4388 domain-containing protein [candidate division KSB1 bacterium]
MDKKLILVLSSDESQLKLLKQELEANIYDVVTATDGRAGFELIRQMQPDFVLSDLHLEKLDGIDLCFMIRQNPKLLALPYMLMTDDWNPELRINGYRSGIDDIVPANISMRELCTRIESLMRRQRQLSHQSPPLTQSLVGKLDDFRLIEIIQMLHLNQKTGLLKVQHQSSEAHIALTNGDIIYARLGEKMGEEAIQIAAFWQEGTFAFERETDSSQKNVHKPTMQIILDCCQLLDEGTLQS